MKFTLLGSGTSQGIPVAGCDCHVCRSDDPRDKRLRCSAWGRSDVASIVIDVGPDFRQQMLHHNVQSIDAVLLTHEHNDHVIGLDDLRPYIFKNNKPMLIYAEQRVIDEVRSRFSYAFGSERYPGAPAFELRAISPGDTIEVGDIMIEAMRVMHGRLPILAFRIVDLVYMTDVSEIPEETLDQIKGTKTLFLDALRREKHHSHFSLSEAISVAKEIGARSTYLIHLSHLMGLTRDWERELPMGIYASYDGLDITF